MSGCVGLATFWLGAIPARCDPTDVSTCLLRFNKELAAHAHREWIESDDKRSAGLCAFGSEVTTSPRARRKLFFVAKLFEGVGTLLAAVLPALLTMAFRGSCELPPHCASRDTGVCTVETFRAVTITAGGGSKLTWYWA